MALEFPQFVLDFDEESKLKERPMPSEKALDIEEALLIEHKTLLVRVEWMQKPLKEKEVVTIREYLGKYLFYQEV